MGFSQMIKKLFLVLPFLFFIETACAGSSNIGDALDEMYDGRRSYSDLTLEFEKYNNIQGEVSLRIEGDGKMTVKKTCANNDCGALIDCRPIERSKRITPDEIRSITSIIKRNNILKINRIFRPGLCDEQSRLTIKIKDTGKFTVQMGTRYFNKERGFAKLHEHLMQLMNDLIEPKKEPFRGEEIEVPPAWKKR